MSLAALDTDTDDCAPIVQVPTARASTDSTTECSHTYDAYGIHGSLERIRTVAHRVWGTLASGGSLADCELDDLRTALYLTQRGWSRDIRAIEVDVGIEWELVEAINSASVALVRDDRRIQR